jgi:hypothetical protein
MRQATACRGESSFISPCDISFRMRMPDPAVVVLLLSTSGSFERSEYCLLKTGGNLGFSTLEDRMQRIGKLA